MLSNQVCLIMGKSFITEWMIENNITKKNFSSISELNDKLSALIVKSVGRKELIVAQVTKAANKTEALIQKLTKDIHLEISSLVLGIGFIQMLLERDYFKVGSERMYFKRICIELYDFCEKNFEYNEVKNATRLTTKLIGD